MTRTEYLQQLDKYLHRLPEEDYQEAMDYFTEYFDEAGVDNEDQVMAELGTPKEAAQDILNALWEKQENQDSNDHKSRTKTLWIALLALFAAPLAIPTIIVMIGLIITFVAVIVAFVVTSLSLLVAGVATVAVLFWETLTLIPASLPALAMSFGALLLVLGFGLLLWFLLMLIIKIMIRALVAIIGHITKKGKKA
ncbi:DUF1700 domain-containing protein [Streptococcus pluranimalium]|uniref:DUF1700 domain-containing protein n=1 Tax=Streptococcus pluranimalium TaxID=82348 RepID=UPI0039FC6268